MNADLFLLPFLAGLPLAVLLPLLGVLLRLRDEWLATLGLAHLATASALAGLAAGLPVVWGAPLGAVAGALLKYFGGQRSNSAYGLMILAGWAATLLIAANSALGDALAHGVVDGQLYFAGPREVIVSVITALLGLHLLSWLTPRLIRARLLPTHEAANRLPAWRWHLGFDLLVALAVAVAIATLGLMAAFALIFLPAWMAFRLAPDWRRCQALALGVGLGGYGAAFALALTLDQPFGPTLVTALLLMGLFAGARGRRPVKQSLAGPKC